MAGDDIVTRLRKVASDFPTVNGWMDNEWTNAADEIERLRKDRDEARRMVCKWECEADTNWIDSPFPMQQSTPRMFAMLHGWDCYKEASDER
jgi:hypothetical protein